MLNVKKIITQTSNTSAIHVLINKSITKIEMTLIANGSKSQISLSAKRSKDRASRLTFCTKEPAKLFVKNE